MRFFRVTWASTGDAGKGALLKDPSVDEVMASAKSFAADSAAKSEPKSGCLLLP